MPSRQLHEALCMRERQFVTPAAFEADIPPIVRGIWYAVFMAYLFLGIAIIADIFMSAIEAVTSRKAQATKKTASGLRRVTYKVWNDTVATLSLMALGSSAPEIFLSVIELFKRGMHSGDLGPSTIVGSAAFNLFCIIAVCVYVIPPNEFRVIENLRAFYVTSLFSICAYMWLVLILVLHTPDVCDVSEAVLTLLGAPMLVWVSYSVERGVLAGVVDAALERCCGRGKQDEEEPPQEEMPVITFDAEELSIHATGLPQTLEVTAKRSGWLYKHVNLTYRTERLNAVPGFDFEEAQGEVELLPGEASKVFELEIPGKSQAAVKRTFIVIMEAPDGDVEFDREQDGGEQAAILTVTVLPKQESSSSLRVVRDSVVNFDAIRVGNGDWKEQILSALYVNGEAEEQEEASRMDWFFHFLSLPWRLTFSLLVPPTTYFGGWLCFFTSIVFVGALTGVVSDVAELFGCVLEIPDIVTAITFVALGTSMPDLFASMSAAAEDPTADASIVNVTGSNSVNVFLGLGLPWTLAAFFWSMPGARSEDWARRYPDIAAQTAEDSAAFVVYSLNLGFSVLVFSCLCVLALVILVLRAKWGQGELGGERRAKVASSGALVLFWLGFVFLVSWRVIRCAGAAAGDLCKASIVEQGAVGLATIVVMLLTLAWPTYHLWRQRGEPWNPVGPGECFPSEQSGESDMPTLAESTPGSRVHSAESTPGSTSSQRTARLRRVSQGFDGPAKSPHEVLQRLNSKAGSPNRPVLLKQKSAGLSSQTSAGIVEYRRGSKYKPVLQKALSKSSLASKQSKASAASSRLSSLADRSPGGGSSMNLNQSGGSVNLSGGSYVDTVKEENESGSERLPAPLAPAAPGADPGAPTQPKAEPKAQPKAQPKAPATSPEPLLCQETLRGTLTQMDLGKPGGQRPSGGSASPPSSPAREAPAPATSPAVTCPSPREEEKADAPKDGRCFWCV